MNVKTLIDLLSRVNPEAEVRIATQPSWPLQFRLSGVCDQNDVREYTDPDPYPYADQEDTEEEVVWLVEGGQLWDKPYAPKEVFECAWV